MKKRRFFTLALLGLAVVFASCSKDDEEEPPLGPSLTVNELITGATNGSIEITQGEPLVFAWETRKGDSKLSAFSISQTGANVESPVPDTYAGHELPYNLSGDDKNNYVDTLSFTNAGTNLGTTNYTFSVTDGAGLSTSVTFNVTVVEAESETPLSEATPFTWTRVGGSAATGLDQFGLKWTENTSTSAIVAIDEGTTMVSLASSDWNTITNHGELQNAIDNGTTITSYTGVSATQNGTYDDVLGVTHDGVNYLIHVTTGTVTTGSSGTTIAISGMYKN